MGPLRILSNGIAAMHEKLPRQYGMRITKDSVCAQGTCQERLCPVGTAFVQATGFCHDQFSDFCPGENVISLEVVF